MSKYDCNKALDYVHEVSRMCREHDKCVDCPIKSYYFVNPNALKGCHVPSDQEKIDIVQKWSDEYPDGEKTILDDFKEKYPNCYINRHGIPDSCADHLYSSCEKCEHNGLCTECWNRPLSEVMR